MAGSREIYDPWSGGSGIFTDEIHETEMPSHSQLLGPDGRPLRYKLRKPIGFDLRAGSSNKIKSK